MTKFLIVRHGESENNTAKRHTGHMDISLTDTGLMQGREVSQYIYENYKVDAIYSSDLSRAVNTILPLSEKLGMEIQKTKAFREVDVGIWQGMTFDETLQKYPEVRAALRLYPATTAFPGGESYKDTQKRAAEKIMEITKKHQGETVVVAAHGGLIRALYMFFMNKPIENLPDVQIVSNASLTEVDFDGEAWNVLKYSFDDYMKNVTRAENE